jgi:hypothetical protein
MNVMLLAVAAVFIVPSITTAAEYDLLELPSSFKESALIERVTGISDSGTVTVTLNVVEPAESWYRHVRYEAAFWNGRRWHTLLPTGAHDCFSAGLARGRVPLVNAYFDGPRPRYNAKPLLWRNEEFYDLFKAPMPSPDTEVTQVNKRGDVIGRYYLRSLYTNHSSGAVHPVAVPTWFVLRNGKHPVDLAALSRGRVRNVLANSRGDLLITAADSNAPAFPEPTRVVWLRNGELEIPSFPASWSTWPILFASDSFVGAFAVMENSNIVAAGIFRTHKGTVSILNATNEFVTVSGINDAGDFVGHSVPLGHTNWSAEVRGFVFRDGSRTELNDLVPRISQWQYVLPEAINDKGSIACIGVRKNEERASVVLLRPRAR